MYASADAAGKKFSLMRSSLSFFLSFSFLFIETRTLQGEFCFHPTSNPTRKYETHFV